MNAELAGQLFFFGIKGTSIDSETKKLLSRLQPGGIILFKRNIESVLQVRSLIQEIDSYCKIPPFIAVDQEGGRVQRLSDIIPAIPSPLAVMHHSNIEQYQKLHYTHARILAYLGINLNFYPVVDLFYKNKNNLLGDRCLSEQARVVTYYAKKIAGAYARAGIFYCFKHFPGLGATDVDSHELLPVCSLSLDYLWSHDLLPYRLLVDRIPMIMVAHCRYDMITADMISSLSPAIIGQLLVGMLGYEGLVVTDDLEMKAVSNFITIDTACIQAIRAGNNLAMICHRYDIMWEAWQRMQQEIKKDTAFLQVVQKRVMHTLYHKAKRNIVEANRDDFERNVEILQRICETISRKEEIAVSRHADID